MNRFSHAAVALVIVALTAAGLRAAPVAAATAPTGSLRSIGSLDRPVHAQYNEYGGDSWNWADSDIVATYRAPEGIGVVRYLSSGGPRLVVDVFDAATLQPVMPTRTATLNSSYPVWGGFHAGSDGHFYALSGRENASNSLTATTMIVQRFSPTWAHDGTATIAGRGGSGKEGILVPFDAAAADMTIVADRLVVHTGRTMFSRHQADFTFEVDTASMKATPFTDLGGGPYSSHSFNQLVTTWQDDLVLVDHGDAYPRGIQMTVMDGYPTKRVTKDHLLQKLPGRVGDNTTGTSITGIGSGPRGVLVVGNAVRLTRPSVDNREARNAFVIAANPATGATTVRPLTSFSATGASFAYEPRIAKVADDRFAVIFMTEDAKGFSTQYRLLDSAGTVLGSRTLPGMAHASIDDPTLVGSRLFWASTAPGSKAEAHLYGLDVSAPEKPRLLTEPPLLPARPAPTIEGVPEVGRTLTARTGGYGVDGVGLTYRWAADGQTVAGATSSTFTPTPAQAGSTMTVTVVASKAGYESATSTSQATARVTEVGRMLFPATPTPTLTGKAKVGAALTAAPGHWGTDGVTFAYQWAADGKPVAGATGPTFRPTAVQVGRRLTVGVTATKQGYSSQSRTSARTVAVARGTIVPGKPSVSGRAKIGATLTAKVGSWRPSGLTYRYQWLVDGKRIKGATSSTYRVGSTRKGHRLSVKVAASRSGYTSVSATSGRTAVVKR